MKFEEGDTALLRVQVARADSEQALLEIKSMEGPYSLRVPLGQLVGPATREEWELTGDPGSGYPPYRFVFGRPNRRTADGETPEEEARHLVRAVADGWSNVRLRRRTVIETDWEEA